MLNRLALAPAKYHQWIQYLDAKSKGWCEPEYYYELEDKVLLLEIKLTGGPNGKLQMEGLYKPLLEHIYKKPVVCLLVCKNMTVETPGPYYGSPEEFLASGESFGCWHWIGE